MSHILSTERLVLRPWQESDFEPFASLNADPRVMEYFPSTVTREKSDQMARSHKTAIETKGWGLWAAALLGSDEFIGFIGLNELTRESFPAPFTPAVEIGWRLGFGVKATQPKGRLPLFATDLMYSA